MVTNDKRLSLSRQQMKNMLHSYKINTINPDIEKRITALVMNNSYD